jgi:hypothetical protein
MESREDGHRRVPAPPHMMVGIIIFTLRIGDCEHQLLAA